LFRQGVQGIHDEASNQALESEFGTSKDEEVIKLILQKGTVQESQVCCPFTPPCPSSFLFTYLAIMHKDMC
jgi:hypothetical protein